MLYFDNTLYLEVSDAIKCGIASSENYLYKEKSRGAGWANFAKHPVYKNVVLIEFESLSPEKKSKVREFFGDPYEHFAKEPIRKMVQRDHKAEDFYLNYSFDGTKKLPIQVSEKYTVAASWLNMLIKAQENFKIIKKELGITCAKFWLTVAELINDKNNPIDLPANQIRLREKIRDYKERGYEVLIHKQFGNSNSKKVDCEVSESVLIELISQPNTDDVKACNQYNAWAVKNGKEQITKKTVGIWRRKFDYLVRADRYGVKDNYNRYGKHILRSRPSAPLLLLEHDDNELDLYFQSKGKKGVGHQVYYFNRFVVCVVIDAYNDYPIGWAISETYTKELIRFAYLDAVHHIKQLTGGWYLPHQIRCDWFGLDADLKNDLAKFYQSLAIFTPAAVKVPRGKYIERSFGTTWHQVLSLYKNYAGKNITSNSHVSQDFIDANKRTYPTTEQAPEQVFHFINILRHLVDEKTGLSRQEQWVKAFNESEKSKAHPISEIQLLAKLGIPHSETNKITNRGITPAINCVKRNYEIPDEIYLQTVGKTVQVIYDPMDYSRILVTDYKNLLFIAREQELTPSAIADFKPGDRAKLNDRLEQKRQHMQLVASRKKERQDLLKQNQINIEGLLMAGIHTKAHYHDILLNYSPIPLDDIKPRPKQKQISNTNLSHEDKIREMITRM